MKRFWIFAALLVALAGLPACSSSSFEKDWRHAATVRPGDAFSGRWQGRWVSAKHANSGGALQCLLSSTYAGGLKPGTRLYTARFKAQWLAFHAEYEVPLEARLLGNEIVFSGTHQLPAIYGGTYRFKGRATPQRFISSYDSSYDHGRFELSR